MLYCGLDLSLRSCASEWPHHQGYISDEGVKKRLSACVPWVKALLSGMFGLENVISLDGWHVFTFDKKRGL